MSAKKALFVVPVVLVAAFAFIFPKELPDMVFWLASQRSVRLLCAVLSVSVFCHLVLRKYLLASLLAGMINAHIVHAVMGLRLQNIVGYTATTIMFDVLRGLIIGFLVGTPFVLLRRARAARRHAPGRCNRCDYDLTGNESGVCPECGTKVPPREASPESDRS